MATPRKYSDAEEKALCVLMVAGDASARNKVIENNLNIVRMVARGHARDPSEFDDLVQVGVLGMIHAASRFDVSRGVRFSTYAVYWVRKRVASHIRSSSRQRHPPAPETGKEADADGVMRIRRGTVVSMDTSTLDNGIPLGDVLEDTHSPSPEHAADARGTCARVRAVVDSISWTTTDRAIISMRILSTDPKTLVEMGRVLGVTHQAVRQHEERIIRRIGERMGAMDAA